MRERRRGPDRMLLTVTLGLLAAHAAVKAVDMVGAGWPTYAPGTATPLAEFSVQWDFVTRGACAFGTALAWAAVAWRCRGVGPRGVALAAAVVLAGGAAVSAWGIAVPASQEVDATAWVWMGRSAVSQTGWIPAVPLLALCRRWGEPRKVPGGSDREERR